MLSFEPKVNFLKLCLVNPFIYQLILLPCVLNPYGEIGSRYPSMSMIVIGVTRCHRGGRMRNINAWYLNTHMVYL